MLLKKKRVIDVKEFERIFFDWIFYWFVYKKWYYVNEKFKYVKMINKEIIKI